MSQVTEGSLPEATNKIDTNDETPQYSARGSICNTHNVYRTKPDENGETSWTKELPDTLTEPAEDAESAQYALIVRNEKCYDGRKSLSIHSVVIQSEPLKQFLGKALERYPGVTTTLERLEFKTPFKPLVHRWENILKLRDEEQDPTTKEHVDLFYRIFEEGLRDILARKADMIRNGVITHSLVWTIFEPDDIIVASSGGRNRALLFSEDEFSCRSQAWMLTCRYIDYDGEQFGFRDEEFKVPSFVGTTPITSLPIFPLKFHPDKVAIRESLLARGKSWEAHKGYHYKQYEGSAIGFFNHRLLKYHVKSRIIIDTEAFNVFHASKSVRVKDEDELSAELTDDQRVVTSPMVHGYSLKDKEWLQFYLDCTRDIEWNSRAFDCLVLPRDQENLKDLILAFAKAQSKQADSFDDVVQGKGRGIIMQLSGPPGVGKTLTAESVAEVMQVPLYAMSAGDLGSSADSVEDRLKDILRMIPKWGAVLLLDEADVFMETRSFANLERNELVSIFLRMLEYYEGILFLTTNRAENIDPAFESRVHVSLAYSPLNFDSRRHIWAQFLDRTANTAQLTDAQIDCLAEVDLNGRQIKNLLKTAGLLAWSQEQEMGFKHIETVLGLRESKSLQAN
ncbi:hypothetical protein N7492_009414 [Penicillium capsulatum]|uniref:AAA+ ATPase domain-containing protein n=1 Tax=Penicillium capsulatum TaxID=69766 RepID=A0A9W9LGU5_9EURO|nr:hypothetical protein N7492_009414 [Penicillium capsulatum]KAJ6106807.1 hypothetical protein N7512_010324 [Penicillium capsulatum]